MLLQLVYLLSMLSADITTPIIEGGNLTEANEGDSDSPSPRDSLGTKVTRDPQSMSRPPLYCSSTQDSAPEQPMQPPSASAANRITVLFIKPPPKNSKAQIQPRFHSNSDFGVQNDRIDAPTPANAGKRTGRTTSQHETHAIREPNAYSRPLRQPT